MELLRTTFWDIVFVMIICIIIIVYYTRYLYYFKLNKNKKIFNYSFHKTNFIIKNILYILAFTCLIIAYLWPVWSFWLFNKNTLQNNIVFLLDVSKSMDVKDVSYDTISRLEYAKKFISNFVWANGGNNYSMYIFAWKTENISPLTNDSNWFLTNISSLTTNSITVWWTDIWGAINEIINDYSNDNWMKNIVIISDGWDEWENTNFSNITIPNNFKAFSIWVWSIEWWYIPDWVSIWWNQSYKSYNWELIVSKLNEDSLKQIAKKWNWTYVKADNQNILNSIKWRLISTNSTNSNNNENDLTYVFVIISFTLLFIWYLIDYKKTIWKNI